MPPLPEDGQSTVTLGVTPMYVVANQGTVAGVTETPRSGQLIANSLRDFSHVQGGGGWSYHFIGNDRTGSLPYDPAKVVPMDWLSSPGDWADTWTAPGEIFYLGGGGW